MAPMRLDNVLAEMGRLNDDDSKRQEYIEQACNRMLHQPTLGAQLIARICAADDGGQLDSLRDLLYTSLNSARMARESNLKRGGEFLKALEDAVEMAARQGRINLDRSLFLSSIWTRNNLQAPASLEVSPEKLKEASLQRPTAPEAERMEADAGAAVKDLVDSMVMSNDGDSFAVYDQLTATFPSIAPEAREQAIAWTVSGSEPVHKKLACFWLLSPDATIRLSAAQALAKSAVSGQLPADVAGRLVTLRSWMPIDEARATVDQILKTALRSGTSKAPAIKPWNARSVTVTLQDGAGAQSVVMALQSGRKRYVAMLLLKHGFGVKDIILHRASSAMEQNMLIEAMNVIPGHAVPLPWLENFLAMSMAEGLAHGNSPHPGLVEVADLCGFKDLRPKEITTQELIDSLPAAKSVRALGPKKRGNLVDASEDWWQEHDVVKSWFEHGDDASEILEAKGVEGPDTEVPELWQWMRTRNDFWARHIAKGADLLAAAGHPDAESFTAVALVLAEGMDMKKIPVMRHVHHGTIGMWVYDKLDVGDERVHIVSEAEIGNADEDYDVDISPEQPGELNNILKHVKLTVEWVDGFMMMVMRATEKIPPESCLAVLFKRMKVVEDEPEGERLHDLLFLRAIACAVYFTHQEQLVEYMRGIDDVGMRQWAAGFGDAIKEFKEFWPTKSRTPQDRKWIKRVAAAKNTDFTDDELLELCGWLVVGWTG